MIDAQIVAGVTFLVGAATFTLGVWCGLGRAASRWDAGYAAAIDDASSQNDSPASAKTVYFNQQIDRLSVEAMIETFSRLLDAAEKALEPFAAIVPSTIYEYDGSENEPYSVVLANNSFAEKEFTGMDLARARSAIALIRATKKAAHD